MVIARTPFVESLLALGEIAEAVPVHHFGLKTPVEALVLALGLRVSRTAMQNPDAEPHQPDAELGIGITAGVTPGRTIVHQHGERQAVAAEGPFQFAPHRLPLLIAASRKHEVVARVIVERGQRMATPLMHGKVTLEVHLPKLIRALPHAAGMLPC